MAAIGYLVGWRAHNGVLAALAAFGLILLLRFALSWVGTYVGLCLRPETADQFVPLVFPVSMLSNSFVPTSGMPTVLRVIANWNPVSALVAAARNLFGNPSPAAASAWPLQPPTSPPSAGRSGCSRSSCRSPAGASPDREPPDRPLARRHEGSAMPGCGHEDIPDPESNPRRAGRSTVAKVMARSPYP
jgi:hypothetical protein